MIRHTSVEVERFVLKWVDEHLRAQPGRTNVPLEVDRLAAQLTGDARTHGISGGDICRAVGDIDVFLTEKYEQAAGA
ncbi:MAG: hypothetical protein BGN85_08130 [Alphaproteobacteria bacterium 64-11]|nr:hypothetical protein [Alphaproteobacteria bacterium]OJU07820.1 MAG: hypothetical protein BGN85_08130 [Alphaproteobacteria bacterium 64-11]